MRVGHLTSDVVLLGKTVVSVLDHNQKQTNCFHSMQKWLGLGLGWQSDSVVFPSCFQLLLLKHKTGAILGHPV